MTLLTVSGYRVSELGAPIQVRVDSGDWIGIAAPSEVNASRFLAEFASKANRKLNTVWIDAADLPARKTPQQLTKQGGADLATRVLTSLRLWDVRKQTISSLSPPQKRAAAFISALIEPCDLILVDEALDKLDPWVLPGALSLLKEHEAAKIAFTHRPDILSDCQRILVLNERGLRFDGAPADLLRIIRPATVEVTTADPGAVAALIEPLQLQVRQKLGVLEIQTTEGQKLAAELCLQGYPHIRAVTVRTPTLAEALSELIQ